MVRFFDSCPSGSIKQHCISSEVWTLHEQGRHETASFKGATEEGREGERRPSGAKLLLSLSLLPSFFPSSDSFVGEKVNNLCRHRITGEEAEGKPRGVGGRQGNM